MKLSDTACRTAKAKDKAYKKADGGGLYLEILPSGGKYWRMKYRFAGKEKRLSFGVYPTVTLAEAREEREKAKKLLTKGVDPSAHKKSQKRKTILESQNTFKAVALEWHENQKPRWSVKHAERVLHKLHTDIFPYIGDRPITEIDAPELLDVLRKIEKRGAIDMAHRARQICGQVFRYGIATGRGKRDHAADLKDALITVKTKHFAALDIDEMPAFLKKLESNDARLFAGTRRAIKLLMLSFVRTTELIHATWDEIDLENAIWAIPAERMKMRRPHLVPLSRQMLEILKEQKEEMQHLNQRWVFPSPIKPRQPISNNTILVAIKRMGYNGSMTGHGFRALARTAIRENLGYDADVIERQLAHGNRNKVAAAYDRTQFLPERKIMMQEWSDYLEQTAAHGKVIHAKFGSAA